MVALSIIMVVGAGILIAMFMYGNKIDNRTQEILDNALVEKDVESGQESTQEDVNALNNLSFYVQFEALSKRAQAALGKANVYSLQELLDLDVNKDLENIKGCGPATKTEIAAFQASMHNAGLVL